MPRAVPCAVALRPVLQALLTHPPSAWRSDAARSEWGALPPEVRFHRGFLRPGFAPIAMRCAPLRLAGRRGQSGRPPHFPVRTLVAPQTNLQKTAHPPYDLVMRRIVVCAGFRFILPVEHAGLQGAPCVPCPVFYGYEAKCAACARARCARWERMEVCPFAPKAVLPARRMECMPLAFTLCTGSFRAQKRGLWDCDDGHAGQNRQSACADAHERSHVYACFRRACA